MENEEIISCLKRMLECYKKVSYLTKKQEEAIKSDNIKELNLLITEKENHIKDIKRLEKLNIKLQEEIMLNPLILTRDNRITSLLRQIYSIITNLVNYDQDSIKALSSLIDDIKLKASNLSKRRRKLKSSRMQAIRPPSFIDVVQ
ncbi:MAG: hypothetical protein ACE5KZ_01695 [Candidatus Scalinduaceae bacterium]